MYVGNILFGTVINFINFMTLECIVLYKRGQRTCNETVN